MGKDPETDDEELAGLPMPRDPRLPATQVLEAPPERENERPLSHVGPLPVPLLFEFSDDTLPSPVGDEGTTLDEPMPPHLIEADEIAAEWEEDAETAVDDPAADSE